MTFAGKDIKAPLKELAADTHQALYAAVGLYVGADQTTDFSDLCKLVGDQEDKEAAKSRCPRAKLAIQNHFRGHDGNSAGELAAVAKFWFGKQQGWKCGVQVPWLDALSSAVALLRLLRHCIEPGMGCYRNGVCLVEKLVMSVTNDWDIDEMRLASEPDDLYDPEQFIHDVAVGSRGGGFFRLGVDPDGLSYLKVVQEIDAAQPPDMWGMPEELPVVVLVKLQRDLCGISWVPASTTLQDKEIYLGVVPKLIQSTMKGTQLIATRWSSAISIAELIGLVTSAPASSTACPTPPQALQPPNTEDSSPSAHVTRSIRSRRGSPSSTSHACQRHDPLLARDPGVLSVWIAVLSNPSIRGMAWFASPDLPFLFTTEANPPSDIEPPYFSVVLPFPDRTSVTIQGWLPGRPLSPLEKYGLRKIFENIAKTLREALGQDIKVWLDKALKLEIELSS